VEMDISQYKDLFITESQEHLDSLNKFMLELENDPSNLDVLTEIFRSAHTLKGMSATMGYDQLTELAHEMENLLEHLRTGDIAVTTPVVDTLFTCFDTLGAIINAIAEDRPEEIDFSNLVGEIRSLIEGFSGEPAPAREPARERAPEPEPPRAEETVVKRPSWCPSRSRRARKRPSWCPSRSRRGSPSRSLRRNRCRFRRNPRKSRPRKLRANRSARTSASPSMRRSRRRSSWTRRRPRSTRRSRG